MDNVKGILLILTLALAASTFVLFLQSSTANNQVDDANKLASVTKDLLRAQGIRCSASPEQFTKLAECIVPYLTADDFEQDAFKQPNSRTEETGYLVIVNENKRVYQSELFTFYKNRELTQTGCTVSGEIGLDVTCRFNYPGECADGDILEVFYPVDEEDIRIFLKTC